MRCFLRVADTQGKVLHTTELPIIADSGMRWSQDGRYLALAENISEDSAVIHLYNDNLVLQRSLKVPFRVWRVNWDQGTSGNLLTVPLKGNQKGNLFSIDSSNGGVKQITNFRVASPSGWLYKPSGEFYFICGKKNSRLIFRSLYCYNKNSGKITTIFSSKDLPEVSLLGNDWDQQGNRVAVVSKGRIFIVNVKTKKIEKITDGPEDYYPTFSPDGKKLAYVHNSNNLVIKDLVNGQTDVILP
jgi:Tol biopolymer transport system component